MPVGKAANISSLSRIPDDDTQADALKLLARYRELCELVGGYRATHGPVPRTVSQQIKDLEGELQTRLWLAGRTADDRSRVREGESVRKRESLAPAHTPSLPHFPTPSSVPSPQSANGVVEVFSDGSCLGNPGPGGYGTIVRAPGRPEKILRGGKARTTNNEMELTGAVEGLRAAAEVGAKEIAVISDSEYLVKGMNSWIKGWVRNGWKTRTGDPVKNRELWEELHRLSQGRSVSWNWVAGHAGHPENERCNSLAVAAAQQAASASKR